MYQEILPIILWVFIVILSIYDMHAVVINNKNKTEETFRTIGIHFHKRYKIISNILKLVNRFLKNEKALLDDITSLKSKAFELYPDITNINGKIELNRILEDKMEQLFQIIDNNPDLKTDKSIIQAREEYKKSEKHILEAKKFYNKAAKQLNRNIHSFPWSTIASRLGIKKQELFKINEIQNKESKKKKIKQK